MPAAAIVTLILAGLLVAALAFFLIWVIVLLGMISRTLGGIADALGSIAERTAPVNELMGQVNADLTAVAEVLGDVEDEHEGGGTDAEEAATL